MTGQYDESFAAVEHDTKDQRPEISSRLSDSIRRYPSQFEAP